MDPRFLLDGMLGGLTRWLRICGYDAKYLKKAYDDELLERASAQGLVLLTRDKLLHRKALRAGLESFLVEGETEAEKLASVSRRFGLSLYAECSRCPECGDLLRMAEREEVYDRVPPRTFEAYDEFWVCGSCGKVYWRGSHWRNIIETVEEASRIARPQPSGPEHDL